MSPKGRGRKPKTRRSGRSTTTRRRPADPGIDGLLDGLLREVERELEAIDDVLDAELCVSSLLGTWWQLDDEHADPDVVLGEELVSRAGRRRRPGALALLRVIGAIGTPGQRAAAAEAADALVARGVPEPGWSADLDRSHVTRCWAYGDVYGDQTTVLLTFARGGRDHGLVVLVDHTAGGIARDAFVTADPADALEDLRLDDEPTVRLRELTPAEAAALLAPAVAATDRAKDGPVDEDYPAVRALALARLRLLPSAPSTLPAPEPADTAAVLAEFLGSDAVRELAGLDRDDVAECARRVVDHSDRIDGQPLRVSPAKVEALLLEPDDPDDALPDVVAAWVRWAGRRSGLAGAALEELEDLTAELVHELDGVEGGDLAGLADAVLAGLELDQLTPDELRDVVARRVFAVGGTRTVVDGEPVQLDPRDPDERGLLVRAEHPEYAEALDDLVADTTADGVNPRLHVAIHEIVANQLWDEDPPQAWPAAQRLLATGMDRHDVLHALGEVAIRHLHGALTDRKPVDNDAYAADLDALGAPPAPPPRRRGPGADQPALFDEPARVVPLRPRAPSAGAPTAYQVKVTLRGVKPPVWRRLVLPSTTDLARFHEILQTAMGWLGGHLHLFVAGDRTIGSMEYDPDPDQLDEADVRLDEVLRRPGDKLRYEYDFGDGWAHDVSLEAVLRSEQAGTASCTGGRRACPPEDCGGPWGYADLVEAVADPDHPRHEELTEWAGPYFDPAEFDKGDVNRQLALL